MRAKLLNCLIASIALGFLCLFLAACGSTLESPENLPNGYTVYTGDRVGLALPADWTFTPVSAEDFKAGADKIRATNPTLAERMDEMAQEIQKDTLRFWANHNTDSVTVNIAAESVPFFETVENHAQANRNGLEKFGYTILETDTTELNGKKAAYTQAIIEVNVSDSQSLNWVLIQYTLLDDGTAYSLSFGVPHLLLAEYEPIFEDIANTFHRVD